jgi:hypothetical protein
MSEKPCQWAATISDLFWNSRSCTPASNKTWLNHHGCQDKNKFYKFISKWMIISFIHSSILRRIWLSFMAQYLVFSALIQFSQSDFQLFRPEYHWRDLSSRNAHLVHQICIVLALHFNSWVETTAGGLKVPESLYKPVGRYFGTCLKIWIWIKMSRKQ